MAWFRWWRLPPRRPGSRAGIRFAGPATERDPGDLRCEGTARVSLWAVRAGRASDDRDHPIPARRSVPAGAGPVIGAGLPGAGPAAGAIAGGAVATGQPRRGAGRATSILASRLADHRKE